MQRNNNVAQTTKYYIYTTHQVYEDDEPFIEQFATKADALAKLEWYIVNEMNIFNNPPKEVLKEGYIHCSYTTMMKSKKIFRIESCWYKMY
jgi:hypothetical protein